MVKGFFFSLTTFKSFSSSFVLTHLSDLQRFLFSFFFFFTPALNKWKQQIILMRSQQCERLTWKLLSLFRVPALIQQEQTNERSKAATEIRDSTHSRRHVCSANSRCNFVVLVHGLFFFSQECCSKLVFKNVFKKEQQIQQASERILSDAPDLFF